MKDIAGGVKPKGDSDITLAKIENIITALGVDNDTKLNMVLLALQTWREDAL